jgi:ATP-binding cassette subfamily C protein
MPEQGKTDSPPSDSRKARPGGSKHLTSYLGMYLRLNSWKTWISVVLAVLLGLTQGIGLLMLIPLLRMIGIGSSGSAGGESMAFLQDLLSKASIPLNLPSVLTIYLLIVAFQAMLTRYQKVLNAELVNGFTLFLRNRFNQALAYSEWMTFVRTRAADFTHTLTSEIGRVAGATQLLLNLPGSALIAAVHLAVAFKVSPVMTGAVLIFGSCLILMMLPYNRRVQKSGEALRESSRSMYSSIMEFLSGMKVAKSYGLEETHLSIFRRYSSEIARQLVSYTRIISKAGMIFQISTAVAIAAFIWIAVEKAGLSADRILVLVYIFARLLPRFRGMQQNYHQILYALPSFEAASRMQRQLEAEQESTEPADIAEVPLKTAIQLSNVSFNYDKSQDEPVIRDLDLRIVSGSTTAILGDSGSGKSTLADLIMGLLVPDEGRITVDDEVLSGEYLRSWRHSVGYVPQENFLFHDTIRVNLKWAKGDATESEMLQALESAAALDFVSALPAGIDTIVGDRGIRLSGGERQRIALARALLRKPSLLLLDEATSSVDSRNEALIHDALERLHGDITILIIAHNISSASRNENVVILDKGEIVETGSWSDLIQRPQSRLRGMIEK